MAYIGNTAEQQAFTPAIDYFNGNGSTVAFTLSRPVASVAQVQAVIENVPQNPGDAYTVSGNTITFTSAPPSGTNNIYVYYTSPITQVIQPGQGTVGTAQIVDGSVTSVKIASGVLTPTAVSDQLNVSTGYFDLPTGTTAQRPGSPIAGMTRFNTVSASIEFYNGSNWINVLDGPYSIESLLVAGGGGTGRAGGGAGGLIYYGSETPKTPNGPAFSVNPGTAYSIVIGAGGASGGKNNGNNTTAFGNTAIGGGGGGAPAGGGDPGNSGGSGGGQSGTGGGGTAPSNAAGTSGQGNAGGARSNDNNDRDGGGGGAGAVGGNGNGSGASGNGGNGLQYSINGSATFYAGGGAGVSFTQGVGGLGGGGGSTTGNPGAANTGGGGSGGTGTGGSGVVIIRYAGGQRGTGGTVTSVGGFTIHTFTTSGTYTA